jgi:hypothetical protein
LTKELRKKKDSKEEEEEAQSRAVPVIVTYSATMDLAPILMSLSCAGTDSSTKKSIQLRNFNDAIAKKP